MPLRQPEYNVQAPDNGEKANALQFPFNDAPFCVALIQEGFVDLTLSQAAWHSETVLATPLYCNFDVDIAQYLQKHRCAWQHQSVCVVSCGAARVMAQRGRLNENTCLR